AGDRVAIYLDKRIETVAAIFATSLAAGIVVPVNPLLRPAQLGYILADSGARFLVTSPARLALLAPVLADCPDLCAVILVGEEAGAGEMMADEVLAATPVCRWPGPAAPSGAGQRHEPIDSD